MCPCFELNLLVCFDMCMCTLLLNLHVHHELFGIAIELSLSSYIPNGLYTPTFFHFNTILL